MNHITTTIVKKARKDYHCDSSDIIKDIISDKALSYHKISFTDLRSIIEMRQKGWQIKKGESYIKHVDKIDGDIYTFRSNPLMNEICSKYNLYSED